ncbi:MAG: hypothetical protein PHW14_05545 [Candidatus Omnitrophica bacterium]|jgi:hypothetical protein|nr:hypothetical protein [Candidatus Omnitrophota bacterium]
MKRVIALALIAAFVLACAPAFAADAPAKADVQKESMVTKFFGDAADLFRNQIPETSKSATYPEMPCNPCDKKAE